MAYVYRSFGFGGALTPMVKRLLIANVAAYAVTLLVGPELIYGWFAFQPRNIVFRPWGVFTYMFVHGGLWHLALNMLVLFFFGPSLENRWGSGEFLKYYVICGLGAVVGGFFFPSALVIGASGALYGVMLAFAMNWPDAPIYVWGIFPVKAKWLVAFLFAVSVLSTLEGGVGGGVAHFAHLGGFLTGFAYLKSDWRPGSRLKRLRSVVKTRRMAIVPGGEGESRVRDRTAARMEREQERALYDAVDRVLDKISAHGMESLTPKERKLLDEVSRKHRSN